jgi:hypothetical protein
MEACSQSIFAEVTAGDGNAGRGEEGSKLVRRRRRLVTDLVQDARDTL